MSAQIFKKLRKPGYAPTLLAGLLSNLMVFAEPVNRAANNFLTEKSNTIHQNFKIIGDVSTGNYTSTAQGNNFTGNERTANTVATTSLDVGATNKDNPVSSPAVPEKKSTEKNASQVSSPSIHRPSEEYSIFYAEQNQGVIGITNSYGADNPRDNYFKIILPEDIDLVGSTPVLTYELYGLTDGNGVTKSINGSAAYGGKIMETDTQWKEVEEYLPVSLLRTGTNEVFFTRRVNEVYGYQVKNVRLKLYKGDVTDSSPEDTKENVLETVKADSHLESKMFYLGGIAPEPDYGFHSVRIGFLDKAPSNEGAALTLIGLPFKDVKPINADTENVTLGIHEAYRIQATGVFDSTAIELHLKYDPEKIPLGYTPKDIRTFYYDKSDRSWKALPVEALNREENTIVSFITDPGGGTDYINGVIKVPEQPETSNFVPTTLSDIEFANPAAGVVSIAPPSPNSTGSLSTGFPIKLPAGRNGMQPSLEVSYNSDGGNGWMGMGWDMSMPAITLNTKWGVPLYDAVNESEVYSLSGQDLVLCIDVSNGQPCQVATSSKDYTGPHRDADLARNSSSSRQFYLRKEGSYLSVIRHGTIPQDYYWEVTDKFGNKSFYGGIGNVDNSAVLRDAGNIGSSGNIAHWALVRQEDPYGNYVEYEYDKNWIDVEINGMSGNTISGWEFYIKSIKYTRHSTANSNYYKVDFIRTSGRTDIITSARSGFFQITKDLLSEIAISFQQGSNSQPIRTYEFEYGEGPFIKQRMWKISEFDSEGNLFYSNTLEYFEDIVENDLFTTTSTPWEGSNDIINSPLHDIPFIGNASFMPKGSTLGSSVSKGGSFGLRAAIGIGANPKSISNTIGGSFSYSLSNHETRISFVDINGDGLPDKVYANNNGVYYRPNTGNGFGNLIPVFGADKLSESKSRTTGWGWDANLFGLFGVGRSESKTRTETDFFFMDFNGDGLPDIIGNNRVKFNITKDNSDSTVREFDDEGINNTENAIASGSLSPDIIEFLELETLRELREQFPQFDHVKVWKAPYTGNISITGQATLVTSNNCDAPSGITENNEFKLTVEKAAHNQTTGNANVLLSKSLPASMNLPSSVLIDKGDLLFFRIHNLNNGCGGEVEWDPQITYTSVNNIPSQEDEHGKQMRVFHAKNDFIMNNGDGWSPGNDETIVNIKFNLEDPYFTAYQFSDDIHFLVEKIETDINTGESTIVHSWTKSRVYLHENGNFDTNSDANLIQGINLAPTTSNRYSLRFYARSTSNIAWDEINWKPTVESNGQIYFPSVSYLTYDENVYQSKYWVEWNNLPPIVTIPVGEENEPLVTISHNLLAKPSSLSPSGLATYLNGLKNNGELPIEINWIIKEEFLNTVRVAYKRTFYLIEDGVDVKFSQVPNYYVPTHPDDDVSFTFTKAQIKNIRDNNGKIYTAFYVDNKNISVFNETEITVKNAISPQQPSMTPVVLQTPFMAISPAFFGITYRGWNQFLYNGGIELERDNEEIVFDIHGEPQITKNFGDNPIDMEELNKSNIEDDQDLQGDIDVEDPDNMGAEANNRSAVRVTFYSQDNDNNRYVNTSIMAAVHEYNNSSNSLTTTIGRFGEGNIYDLYITEEQLTTVDSGFFLGLKQRSISEGKANSASISFLGLDDNISATGSGTMSNSTTRIINQYVDLNGDRYPDLVTGGLIQFTNSLGALIDDPNVNLSNNFITKNKGGDFVKGASVAGIKPNSTETANASQTCDNSTITNINAGVNNSKGASYESEQWMDMNGDGLTDKVIIEKDAIKVHLNSGYGFLPEILWENSLNNLLTNVRTNFGLGFGTSFIQEQAVDLDEDQLDFINPSFSVGVGAGVSRANMKTDLIDINNDGLPDLIVRANQDNYNFVYYLNTGTGFDSTPQTLWNNKLDEDVSVSGNIYASVTAGFVVPLLFFTLKVTFSPSLGLNAGFSKKASTIQDIDGDGLPDLLYEADDNGSVNAHLNKVGKTHLLKKVNTPLGGSWEVNYAQVGNTYEMPQSKWVVSELKTHDGFTGDNDFDEAESETLTKFKYDNGYHDRRERDFYGFEKVTTEQYDPTDESLFRYTIKKYHNKNYYLKGALKETAVYTNVGELLTLNRQFYNLRKPDLNFQSEFNTGLDNPFVESGIGELDRTRAFPVLVKTITTTFENTQSLNIVQEFKNYDAFGNITQYINPGTGQEDAYRTEITYSTNPNFSGLPTNMKVFKNSGNVLMRERDADYNIQGKLEKITTHLGSGNTNRVELEYDTYGNTTRIHQLDNLNAAGTSHFTQEIDYDPVVNSYPVEMSDSYGQSSQMVYDYLFGIPVLSTDMNDNSMRTRIDNRGRVIEIAGPNEYHPNFSDGTDWIIRKQYKGEAPVEQQVAGSGPNDYVFESATGSFPAVNPGPTTPTPINSQHHAVTRHKDPLNPGNEFLTMSIVDGFGQAIQLKKKHVMGVGSSTNTVWQVSGKEVKDAFGRVIATYLPTIQTYNTANFLYDDNFPGSSYPPLAIVYDNRDRQTKITQPGESLSTDITYEVDNFMGMFVTKVVNELQQTQDTYTDIRGRQRKTVQNNEITTEFFYNAINELIRVKNYAGYETAYEYDRAGRRTSEFNPDRGITTYSYDNAGHLIEKITSNLKLAANNDVVAYHYDYHRLLEIEYPQHPDNNVSYVYGASTTQNQVVNAVGRLIEMEDATGIQTFAYGRMGELIGQLRSIAVAGKKSYWFNTQWEYDSWNRIKNITYPDSEVVTYHYDLAGQLSRVSTDMNSLFAPLSPPVNDNIVSNIIYTEYGERKLIEYGNGTVSNYDYDERRRMDFVAHQFIGTHGFQIDKNYIYDELSNITNIVSGSVTSPSTGVLGGPVYHNYTYDDYNRLITANGQYEGPDDESPGILMQAYSLEMTYDLSHNIVGKNQIHQFASISSLGQGLPQNAPHAVATSYSLEYEDYAGGEHNIGGQYYVQPHAPRTITEYPNDNYTVAPDDPRIKKKMLDYDANGNMTEIKEQVSDPNQPLGYKEVAVRENLWDEEDRLRAVDLKPEADPEKPEIAAYTYDAGGERTIKYIPGRFDAYYSAKDAGSADRLEAILYPSPLVTVKTLPLPEDVGEIDRITLTKYTKHYYIGSERVSSALGTIKSLGLLCEPVADPSQAFIERMDEKVKEAGTALTGIYTTFEKNLELTQPFLYETQVLTCDRSHERDAYAAYWYHPDHLGSSSYITNLEGEISQHMEYLPFGETLVSEHLNSNNSPYKFNAKELDEETGWYYYSARYYDPKWSIWLSVDPLAELYPDWSPYNYTLNNPIRYTDPTGLAPENCCGINPGGWLGTGGLLLKRTTEIFQRKARGESWASAYANTYKNDAKNVVRYGTPIEDVYGVIMGKDFDNDDYNRAEAGGWALASFIPFAKLGKAFKAFKALEYSDEVGSLVQSTGKFGDDAKEIFTFTKSGTFKDAKTVVSDLIDLGDNAVDYVSTTGKGKNPFYGKTVGKQSANGKSGYRVDWSEDAGAHINWWNGKQKGAIPFSGGLDQAKRIIDNEVIK